MASPAVAAVDPAPVVAAERAFAADGLALGVRDSFLKHSAPTGIVLAPEPTLAKAAFEAPRTQGAAACVGGRCGPGSRGPATWASPRALYLPTASPGPTTSPSGPSRPTVVKWLFDGGPPSDMTGAAAQGSPVPTPLAERKAGSPDKAMTEVTRAEQALHAAAKADVKAATIAAVAGRRRIVGSRAPPPKTRADLEAELSTRPAKAAFALIGGQASRAGDLAWTYGLAQWAAKDGSPQRGHYVRIWRNDKAGWRLLFDEILPAPPLSPPPAAAS
jgi:hypothetical protein